MIMIRISNIMRPKGYLNVLSDQCNTGWKSLDTSEAYWNKATANVCYNQKVKAANKISDNFFWGQTVATMGPDLLLKAPEAPIPILQYEGQRYKLNFNINFWTTIGVNSTVFPIRIFQFQSKYKSKPFIAGLVPVFKYFIR